MENSVIARNTCPICCVFGFCCDSITSTTSTMSTMRGTGDASLDVKFTSTT